MTLDERTLELGAERERLDARLDEFADLLADADDPSAIEPLAAACEQRLAGVSHLCEAFGPDATVTICGLTAGDFARVEDRVAAKRDQESQDSLPGYHRNVYVAAGLADAPFVEEGADDFAEEIATVAAQPVGVVKWLEDRLNDATAVSGEDFRGLGARLADSSGA